MTGVQTCALPISALKDRVLEGWKSLVPVYRWLLAVEADPPPEQM